MSLSPRDLMTLRVVGGSARPPAGALLVVVATFQLWLGQALWRGTMAR